jgi:hypothetical protein
MKAGIIICSAAVLLLVFVIAVAAYASPITSPDTSRYLADTGVPFVAVAYAAQTTAASESLVLWIIGASAALGAVLFMLWALESSAADMLPPPQKKKSPFSV